MKDHAKPTYYTCYTIKTLKTLARHIWTDQWIYRISMFEYNIIKREQKVGVF
jgi:hypothetical protein